MAESHRWEAADGAASSLWTGEADAGTLTAGARTDWFNDPAGDPPISNAPLRLTPVRGDFQFSARVRADLQATYDAGALFVHGTDTTWGKLALERAPDGTHTIVSVITRDVSDDANGVAVATPGESWLRISRVGRVYMFHHSADGLRWSLDRLFTLGNVDRHRVGLCVQSPLGAGLGATFDHILIRAATLADPRDGS